MAYIIKNIFVYKALKINLKMERINEFVFISPLYVEQVERKKGEFFETREKDSKDTFEEGVKKNSLGKGKDGFYLLDDGRKKCHVGFFRENARDENTYINRVLTRLSSSFDSLPSDFSEKLKNERYVLTNYPLADEE